MWCQEHFGQIYVPDVTQLFFSNCQKSVRQFFSALNIPELDTDFAATMRQIERNNYEMVESFKEINKKKGKKR